MFTLPLRPGLELRLADDIDADEQYLLLQSQPAAWETFWAWDHAFVSIGSWLSYVRQMRQRHADETALLAAIYAQGRCIGHLGLDRLTPLRAEIQGWIIPGSMFESMFREALAGLIDYAFAVWKVHRVEIRPAVDQTAYIGQIQTLGLQPEATVSQALLRNGIRYDAVLYSMLASEWTIQYPAADFKRWIDDDLAIRPFELRDTLDVFTIVDANRHHLRPWLSWVDNTQSIIDTEQFLQSSRRKWANRDGWEGGIWFNGQLVGSAGYHYWDFQMGITELGYWLSRDYTGQGIMTRVVRAMTDDALFDLGLNRVVIHCAVGNLASCAIPARLGFTHEGVIREAQWLYDHYVGWNIYAMLADEWSQLAENA
jgi:ribosomal-protein-serine acetyltransferase